MARIPASVLRGFSIPAADERDSNHGAQREDSILSELTAFGWGREASAEAKAAFLPGVAPVKEGNGRGRGATFVDGFRVNPARACGGDFISLKAPSARKNGAPFTTAHDLFTGTAMTLASIINAMLRHKAARKAFPLVVCHTSGDRFSPEVNEWAIVDLPTLLSNVGNPAGWETFGTIPVKPEDFRSGRGGNPSPVWVSYDRKRGYYTLACSLRGVPFRSGSVADFAGDIDRACVIAR